MSSRTTAMDIEGQEFPIKLRGYETDEVRIYLSSLAEEIERLNLENSTLREDMGRLKEQIAEHSDRARSLQETLVTAQQMAEEFKQRSRTESELLVKEARLKSERLLEQAQDQLNQIEAETSRAKLERDMFEGRLRNLIEEHESLLDLRKRERAETDNLHFLRRRGGAEVG